MGNDKPTESSSIESQANQALDDSIESLSPEVRRRLNQIRLQAVEPKPGSIPLWKTASAFGLFLAVAIGWQLWPTQTEMPLASFAEVLEEDLEMLDELEFIYWMAEESESALL